MKRIKQIDPKLEYFYKYNLNKCTTVQGKKAITVVLKK